MICFRKLGITPPLLRSVEEEGFEKPTEVQEKAIPLVLAGRDVIAGSATGSGKTLVFGSGIIQHSEKGRGIQALVLTPTRELAVQITDALRKFSKHKPLEIAVVYGGISINPQILRLRKADVVVGTPGRLLDHIGRRTIDLSNVKILVLDEADRMLDMGFIDDVKQIIRQCPEKRQTLLFSATISDDIVDLARRYMKNPAKVSAESYVDPRKLTQFYYDVPDNLKFSLLVHLLKHEKSGLVMVFCNSRRNTDFVANNLRLAGIDALATHGGLSQDQRNKTMKRFNSEHVCVLVCTDVAARGLDIKGVSHIYNYDIPSESKQYIHRIGRTARAGKEGKAISILSSRDHDNFSMVLEDHSLNIKREKTPRVEQVRIRWQEEQRFHKNRNGRLRAVQINYYATVL
ncbi:ATP-dependent helicase [Candidatus Woesearchaeota archaeon CG08_land_8_20_14_0_20_47_9]|nr:MAG: ATP-dependent helicase [Candidatus Woesearchaeota archaeon CG08_land_8_20_14_0_20_47_9]HII29563.1 DEAD/DEAH box helicase [Candidatus Woesearchaeota archaeon]